MLQLRIPFAHPRPLLNGLPYRERMLHFLRGNLDFHGQKSVYAAHGWHAFPAKFPPQLPRSFIMELTDPGDIVLDPMMGSGTTLVEAVLMGRTGVGTDIDPLAIQMVMTKLGSMKLSQALNEGLRVAENARKALQEETHELAKTLEYYFDSPTKRFVDYWFAFNTQLELIALIHEIQEIRDSAVRRFLNLAFSSIIITKSGGVSLAKDLAHTRPHRVESKTPNSAIEEFKKRVERNRESLIPVDNAGFMVAAGNAQALPFADESIDLIVTSPPYASHAIDYMRAHKFSLVWFGHSITELGILRRKYIGGDALCNMQPLPLPSNTAQVVALLESMDKSKARVLHRYYSEMSVALSEMYRVLKPGRAAIVVVGTSVMRGLDTETQICLGEIGKKIGFNLVHIGVRRLDRDKRMMPARWNTNQQSQIEARMHDEYVIGFQKPEVGK
jgi:DNA modification methylase